MARLSMFDMQDLSFHCFFWEISTNTIHMLLYLKVVLQILPVVFRSSWSSVLDCHFAG